MIVLVASEKGGTGKTTIATNLSAMRALIKRRVLLIDTDPQSSASDWSSVRDENAQLTSIICMQKFGDIYIETDKLKGLFDDIIIDAGGRDSREMRTASLIADKMIIPVQASQFDIWSISEMERIVSRSTDHNRSLIASVVINRTNPNPKVKDLEEAMEIMKDLETIKLSQHTITERVAFRRAARQGRCVAELTGTDHNPKANNEIDQLYREIYDVN